MTKITNVDNTIAIESNELFVTDILIKSVKTGSNDRNHITIVQQDADLAIGFYSLEQLQTNVDDMGIKVCAILTKCKE